MVRSTSPLGLAKVTRLGDGFISPHGQRGAMETALILFIGSAGIGLTVGYVLLMLGLFD